MARTRLWGLTSVRTAALPLLAPAALLLATAVVGVGGGGLRSLSALGQLFNGPPVAVALHVPAQRAAARAALGLPAAIAAPGGGAAATGGGGGGGRTGGGAPGRGGPTAPTAPRTTGPTPTSRGGGGGTTVTTPPPSPSPGPVTSVASTAKSVVDSAPKTPVTSTADQALDTARQTLCSVQQVGSQVC